MTPGAVQCHCTRIEIAEPVVKGVLLKVLMVLWYISFVIFAKPLISFTLSFGDKASTLPCRVLEVEERDKEKPRIDRERTLLKNDRGVW